jgi:hypothetical protein
MAEKGADQNQIRIWAGHTDARASSRYVHGSEKVIKPMAEMIE